MDYSKLSPEEKKAYLKMLEMRHRKEDEYSRWLTTGFPKTNTLKKLILGLLGLPYERRARPIQHPIVISSFISAFVGIFIAARSQGLELVLTESGFIGPQFYRHYFLTIITSFFLHGSWMHLLGNSYYFLVFGDDVEDEMKFFEFIRFLFWGHVCGLGLHSIMTGFNSLPLVGASAGVSALLGFYMIRFPKRQITYMLFIFYFWIHLPAFGVFIWKFGWEYMVATSGVKTQVAHWAHLGGAAWGVWVALTQRKRRLKN